MYCSYHPNHVAQVRCSSCSRSLCPACDHRIRGYPYCQDCILLGIQSLSQNYYRHREGSKAALAGLLGIVPGLGAVYNRQNFKAAIHFLAVVGTFQLTHLHFMSGLFALGGVVLYIYSIIDAYRTAQKISRGESAAVDEARFKRSVVKSAPYVGVFFIICGILTVVQMVHPVPLLAVAKLLPVALILLGGFLLTRYFRRSAEEESPQESPAPPYALTSTPLSGRHSSGPMRLVRRDR
jgi:hypothetical protein